MHFELDVKKQHIYLRDKIRTSRIDVIGKSPHLYLKSIQRILYVQSKSAIGLFAQLGSGSYSVMLGVTFEHSKQHIVKILEECSSNSQKICEILVF